MAIVIRSINKFIFQASCSSNNGVGNKVKKQPPIFVSTNPSNINIHALSKLYCACNHSPHRFSAAIEDIDAGKLGIAISHSSVVVSVFASVTDCDEGGVEEKEKGLLGRILPAALVGVPAENGELVGFGRAASDQALTASIYDVMVSFTLFLELCCERCNIVINTQSAKLFCQIITRTLFEKAIKC